MFGLSPLIAEASFKIKLVTAIVSFIATASAFYVGGKSLLAVPEKLIQHDSVTVAGFRSIDKMLCIQIADHRKLDWRLCYINPSEVMPIDSHNP